MCMLFHEKSIDLFTLSTNLLFVLDIPRLSYFNNATSSYDLLNSLIYLLVSSTYLFEILSHKYVISIKTLTGLFITTVSLIQIFTISV